MPEPELSRKALLAEDKPPLYFGWLLVFLGISAGMLALGGYLTYLGMDQRYQALHRPSWQPPDWVFAPVWTVLLLLTAVATWLVFRDSQQPAMRRLALGLYGLQIVLNLGWSLIFFTWHQPSWGLLELFVLDVVLLAMIGVYAQISKVAAWLLVPYALWLGLATAINLWIVAHN